MYYDFRHDTYHITGAQDAFGITQGVRLLLPFRVAWLSFWSLGGKVMQDIKGNSSRWLNQRRTKFAWQEGFGAYGVSASQKQTVCNYIARQEEHHSKWTFEQEYVTLLRKSGAKIDWKRIFD